MTPEHKFTLWITVFTSLPAIAFTGVVAYWTWRRDQERIIVRKAPLYWETLDDSEGPLESMGVAVTNLSLYPVRICGLGFLLDGKDVLFLNQDLHKDEWLSEIPSHSRMIVYANASELKQLEAVGIRERINDRKFVAAARTETGGLFFSNRRADCFSLIGGQPRSSGLSEAT